MSILASQAAEAAARLSLLKTFAGIVEAGVRIEFYRRDELMQTIHARSSFLGDAVHLEPTERNVLLVGDPDSWRMFADTGEQLFGGRFEHNDVFRKGVDPWEAFPLLFACDDADHRHPPAQTV